MYVEHHVRRRANRPNVVKVHGIASSADGLVEVVDRVVGREDSPWEEAEDIGEGTRSSPWERDEDVAEDEDARGFGKRDRLLSSRVGNVVTGRCGCGDLSTHVTRNVPDLLTFKRRLCPEITSTGNKVHRLCTNGLTTANSRSGIQGWLP